jgi:hypothetical protein
MKTKILQLLLVRRSEDDLTCYKDWKGFQLFVVDGYIEFIIDGITVQVRDGISLEVRNIYHLDNIMQSVTVTCIAPDNYNCISDNGEMKEQLETNAHHTFTLVSNYMLPTGMYS